MGLRERVEQCTAAALGAGALEPIETRSCLLDDNGVPYVVRVVEALGRKPRSLEPPRTLDGPAELSAAAAAPTDERQPNPFLPYDRRLFVADVAPSHVALLNKYPVIANHLLLVTRKFEDQRERLTLADFEALARCMDELGGLGFYNGGVVAGASQRHKHLQLVPLPLEPQGPAVPFEPLLGQAARTQGLQRLPALPFAHLVAWLDLSAEPSSGAARARTLHASYLAMLDALGVTPPEAAYNLLCTCRWLMIVPREREHFGPISVNALGFVGGLLARNQAELELIGQAGVRRILASVGRAP